jgi:hypothetical protein
MAALLATRRKHLAASCGLHARTESVRFRAPALARLISALWQSYPPLVTRAEHAKFQVQNSLSSTHAAPNQAAVHKPHLRPSANQLV